MLRLACASLLMTLSTSATLAAGLDSPPEFSAILYAALGLIFAVPAMGLGFVLGNFLTLGPAVLVVTALAAGPTLLLWPESLVLVLMFAPLTYLGWRLGRKEAARALQARHAYGN